MSDKIILCISQATKSFAVKRIGEESEKLGYRFINARTKDFYLDLKAGEYKVFFKGERLNPDNLVVIPRNPVRSASIKSKLEDFQILISILSILKAGGAQILNYECLVQFPTLEDKLFQQILFSEHKVPSINTMYFSSQSVALSNLDKFYSRYPLVKPRKGSKGVGIEVINDREIYETFILYEDVEGYLAQEFIPNDSDIRLIVTRQGIFDGFIRRRQKGYVNNISQGGLGSKLDLNSIPNDIKNSAIKLCQVTNADYLGIDIIANKETSEYKIMEINRFCHFKGFEEYTGRNVAKKLIDLAINKSA